MGLESGKVALNSTFDEYGPMQVEDVAISGSRQQSRLLTVLEILTYGSNSGLVQIALLVGTDYQRGFLDKLGLLQRVPSELPDGADPVVPAPWGKVRTALVALGGSLQVTPLHVAVATSALTNGGLVIWSTVVKQSGDRMEALRRAVVGSGTSQKMRYMARLNTEAGASSLAEGEGYYVGGISGTLGTFDGVDDRRNAESKLITAFTASFPAERTGRALSYSSNWTNQKALPKRMDSRQPDGTLFRLPLLS
jgi:cell division protein FtsI (penicillin-binding protein 3)